MDCLEIKDGGNINISGLLEVTNAERFINNDNITADTLTITTEELTNTYNGSDKFGKIFVTDISFYSKCKLSQHWNCYIG